MTQQVNGTTQNENELSDEELFDLEWEDEGEDANSSPKSDEGEDTTETDGSEPEGDEKAADKDTASESEVPADKDGQSPGQSDGNPAEGMTDDIWATATPAQKEAFLKAQNDFRAMKGRHQSSEKEKSDLQKELEKAQRSLSEATREKGVFETENPELFAELMSAVDTRLPKEQETQAEQPDSDGGDLDLKPVFKAHPDASDVVASEEWAEFQNNMTVQETALFQSEDPFDFIQLMTDFKVKQALAKAAASKQENETDDPLDDAATVSRGGSSVPSKKPTVLNDQDAFDAEWDDD